MVGISLDEDKTLAALSAFVRRRDINYEILYDDQGAAARSFGVTTLPTTYILGPDGGPRGAQGPKRVPKGSKRLRTPPHFGGLFCTFG